ncbi:TetR/AcrR family transcriptional regulator [Candidatus Poriferisodalis sp.]|uniref:TetR/AcrR family transcriptional regulator n=1 Tax=Candidatus Poriferisodalis sp. TaxID=3101277 RepID=UPI003C6FB3E8
MAERGGLARHRAERAGESSSRRSEIIDAAEALFLERGIAATTVIDIARHVGVTRTTFYRYFEGRDELAFEVAGRMITKLATKARGAVPAGAGPVEAARAALGSLITHFEHNSDAHRYLTLLDSYRPFRSIGEEHQRRYTSRSREAFNLDVTFADDALDDEAAERLVALTGVVMGVLGRFAIKREILGRGPVALQKRLEYLEELVHNYFDTIVTPLAGPPARSSR